MITSFASSAYQRISQLASQPRVHQAFQWLHLHEKQLRDWQLKLISIPAPPFQERTRAEWLRQQFEGLGLSNAHPDPEGNVLAELPGTDDTTCVLLSAHIDTVFPAGTPVEPLEDGDRILAPGACDNAAGVTALLGLAAALKHTQIKPACTILFAGNVGEEGEGNLRGMRHLFQRSPYKERIGSTIVLDGSGTETVVTHALGSRRFHVLLQGPGGHSWTDSASPNPILVLSRALATLSNLELPGNPRTTLNVGVIQGGTSVNSIPESASAQVDLRSTDPEQLIRLEVLLHRAVEDAVLSANLTAAARGRGPLAFRIQTMGHRPAATLPEDAPILQSIRAVDRHLGLRTEPRISSTDANIPLSLGREALCIGAGGTGGGTHTRQEWYDPTGRELALRRILLLLLDQCQSSAAMQPIAAD
jgi:acetylornithine deacetylase/succinyl-diaminopimelate desuccinylase-like protein